MDAPLLHSIENITYPAQYQALRRFYAGPAAGFKVYLDDACALPSDWKSTWDHPRQWGLTGNKNWATKYGAQGFIPHMLSLSPFVTTDWRQASASIAVVFARQYAGASANPNPNPNPNLGRAGASANPKPNPKPKPKPSPNLGLAGGPTIIQQQCLQRLRTRSAAFQATNGSRHFFIFTDSRGPCCLDGKYKDVSFLKHHIIGPHGDSSTTALSNLPTPSIAFHRLP